MTCSNDKILGKESNKELQTYLRQPEALKMQGMVNKAFIDNKQGIAATGKNANVNYAGFKVMMKPSKFLQLARPIPGYETDKQSTQYLTDVLKGGGKVGSPYLDIKFSPAWFDGWNPYHKDIPKRQQDFIGDITEAPQVTGHEGRHRMQAILDTHGDIPVEVHLFPRNNDNTIEGEGRHPALLEAMRGFIRNEEGTATVSDTFETTK